ncbi:DNA polymerase epsilon subunit 3 [Olea europaea subsp. europaea]|uniref:DNA polymerase epsilon subunit 3 n=1 Tax=Olea europaea subsp. europaea TaxID=158383 RepID=A0A8S0VA65_OLEEU|nr:DNA polymerase epsilon subunit 3 [Olea europaea subsp. europaea]
MSEKEKDVVVTEKVVSEADELPKTIVRRVVKDKLSQLSKDSEVNVLRESLQGFCESARIFIHFLSATASDVCKESKRQIINAEDVFKALEEIEFAEFVAPLRTSLEEFRRKNAKRKSESLKAKEMNKKGKMKEPPVTNGGGSEEEDEDESSEE